MKLKKSLNFSQDEVFKLRSIAQSFNAFKRKVLTASDGSKYYSFYEVILSKSECEFLEKIETLNPLDYD